MGIRSSVSHTRTSKSVPMSMTRSGRSARHSLLSKMRAHQRSGAGRVLDKARFRPTARHVGKCGLLLAGIGESQARETALRRHDQRGAERGGWNP